MLESLHLKNVGPAPELVLELAPRLNLITGDNGLGKSFLLDVAWWVLTRRWPHDLNPRLTSGYPARPTDPKAPATIAFRVKSRSKSVDYESHYSRPDQSWQGRAGRPWNPGLVIYAHADGGFSVWDPARNYWKTRRGIDVQERLPGYVLSPNEVWNGLTADVDGRPTIVCNGLIADWANWIREDGESARRMEGILARLAPDDETMAPGPLMRLSLDDVRDIPSIRTAYSAGVPILHASSGVRRAVGLAYMLAWAWSEHMRATELSGDDRASQIVMLFDEIEGHLHPRWQRTILSSLLYIAGSLHEQAKIQLIAATHSPLILASAEPFFDPAQDAWFDLDLDREKAAVVLHRKQFVRHGEVSNWLTSEAFDLKSARSVEAEQAIEQALLLLRTDPAPAWNRIDEADRKLRAAALPDIDPFWVRWGRFVERVRPSSVGPK